MDASMVKDGDPLPRWLVSGIIKIIIVINFDQHWSFLIKIVILSKIFAKFSTQPNFGPEYYLDEFEIFENLKNFDGFLCRGACSTCLLLIFSGSVSSKSTLPCKEKKTVISSPKIWPENFSPKISFWTKTIFESKVIFKKFLIGNFDPNSIFWPNSMFYIIM